MRDLHRQPLPASNQAPKCRDLAKIQIPSAPNCESYGLQTHDTLPYYLLREGSGPWEGEDAARVKWLGEGSGSRLKLELVGRENKATGEKRVFFQGFKLGLLVAKLFPIRWEGPVAASPVGGRPSVLIRGMLGALRRSLLSCHGLAGVFDPDWASSRPLWGDCTEWYHERFKGR